MKHLKPEENPKFTLEIINNDEEEVYKVLGISEERSDEIAEIAKKTYNDEKYFTDTLKAAIEQMKHINEVVFMTLCLAKVHQKPNDELKTQLELLKLLIAYKK